MTPSVRVSQLSFETPVTSVFADILTSQSQFSQAIDETIVTVAVVIVTAISLEIPVSNVVSDRLTSSQESVQTIDEVIVNPVEPPAEQPSFGTAPAAFVGAAPVVRESPRNVTRFEQRIDEVIIVSEVIVSTATFEQSIYTLITEKIVYTDPAITEISPVYVPSTPRAIKFETIKPRGDTVSDADDRVKRRQQEEDELILLGVLG